MKNEESSKPSYDDFEPYCEWNKEDGASIFEEGYILEIQLQGFKKEELQIEIRKDGFLYIRGEHPMGKNQIKRFTKRIDVSKYEIKEIDARFEAGKLHLRLPCENSAISFLTVEKDHSERVGILRLGNKFFKRTTSFAMAVAFLLPLGFYMYKYSECTNFRNWFKPY